MKRNLPEIGTGQEGEQCGRRKLQHGTKTHMHESAKMRTIFLYANLKIILR